MVPIIIAVVYFLLLTVVFGIWFTRRIKVLDDFTRAGQSLSWPLVMFGFTLLPLGAGHTLSLWEASAGLGASVLWWSILAGGVFVPLMMLWLGPTIRGLKVQTFPEVMDKIFGKEMGWLHASVNVASWTGIAAAETLASAAAIYGLSGGAIPYAPWCVLIAFILIVCYVFFAGVLQMVWMNVVNAIVMIVGSYLAVIMTGVWLAANMGGWTAVGDFYVSAGEAWKLEIFNMPPPLWFQVVIPVAVLHICACGVFQGMYQPLLAAKSDADCRKGVFLGSIINVMAAFPWVIMAMVGMAIPAIAKLGPKLSVPQLAITALPAPIVGLLMISLLSATLSSAGAQILGNANIITHDILKRAINPKMSDRTALALMRVMILVCAVLALIPALTVPIVFPVFLWAFSFGIPVFVIYVIGLKWKISKSAAWLTIGITYLVNFIWTFWTPSWAPGPFALNMYPVTVCSLVLGIILTAILPGEPGLITQRRGSEIKTSM
ncbi:MAG: hypothetical protein K6T65_03575 [Peptococcaceae bacterium]|nr:hypothetical protein [Peptococcaceae bacterium]